MMCARETFVSATLALLVAGAITPALAAMPERPTLSLTTLDGQPWSLAAQRGHWVIVNYWATWCSPCIKEMPAISRFVRAHAKVRAIGVAYDDSDPADIRAFIAEHPVSYPIAQVTLDTPPKDFDDPANLPVTYLIAPDGRVARRFVGPLKTASLASLIGESSL